MDGYTSCKDRRAVQETGFLAPEGGKEPDILQERGMKLGSWNFSEAGKGAPDGVGATVKRRQID